MQLNSNIKLLYISPRDLFKNRADAVHIMYSCAAFANHGLEVTLLAPYIKRSGSFGPRDNVFELYDVPTNFAVKHLKPIVNERNDQLNSYLLTIGRLLAFTFFLLKNRKELKNESIIVYSKCYTGILPFIFAKKIKAFKGKLILEMPYVNKGFHHRLITHSSDLIFTAISIKKCKEKLISHLGINKSKIFEIPIRFQTDYSFGEKMNKLELRAKLGWHEDVKYVVYAGKTFVGARRLEIFIEASKNLPDYHFVIVGATPEVIRHYSLEHMTVFPFQSYREYQAIISAGDILVATYEDNEFNRNYLGPGKSGPFLLTGNPVIFTDLPGLRNQFSQKIVSFVKPDCFKSLSVEIKTIVSEYNEFKIKAARARSYVLHNTFTLSAISQIKFIQEFREE